MHEQAISAVNLPGKITYAHPAPDAVAHAVEELVRQLTAAAVLQPGTARTYIYAELNRAEITQ
jgi:hypothetical protein